MQRNLMSVFEQRRFRSFRELRRNMSILSRSLFFWLTFLTARREKVKPGSRLIVTAENGISNINNYYNSYYYSLWVVMDELPSWSYNKKMIHKKCTIQGHVHCRRVEGGIVAVPLAATGVHCLPLPQLRLVLKRTKYSRYLSFIFCSCWDLCVHIWTFTPWWDHFWVEQALTGSIGLSWTWNTDRLGCESSSLCCGGRVVLLQRLLTHSFFFPSFFSLPLIVAAAAVYFHLNAGVKSLAAGCFFIGFSVSLKTFHSSGVNQNMVCGELSGSVALC